jgi:hypothetical protein
MFASGFASTHFVNNQLQQLRIGNSPEPLALALLDPFPTFAMAKMVELNELALKVNFVDSLFSGMLHIAELMP